MADYLIRLDDACETMDAAKWQRMADMLNEFNIKPLVGVIPANEDKQQVIDLVDPLFWDNMRKWDAQGWEICMHGFNHVYESEHGGLHPVNNYSEFAGRPLEAQRAKIVSSIDVFKANKLFPRVFFAPAHTFDENTLTALELETDIRVISDTVALSPYRRGSFVFVPQQIGRARAIPFGTITFCYHPNTMTDNEFDTLATFLTEYRTRFRKLDQVLDSATQRSKSTLDHLLTKIYFFARRARSALS